MRAGRELDAWIGIEVMGYSRHDTLTGGFAQDCQFSEDISSAWQVVEKMRDKGWYFTLNTDGPQWNALFWHHGDADWAASSDFAPHAICLAAKAAIETRG